MPANSFLGQRAIVRNVVDEASYEFDRTVTTADVEVIPSGGTILLLPEDPNDADFYAWCNTDGSCGTATPITLQPQGDARMQGGATSAVFSAGFASGYVAFIAKANKWAIFNTSPSSGGGGAITTIEGTAPIAVSGGTGPTAIVSHDASGVVAGIYAHATVTVEADGHVTSASSGAPPVTSVTATAPIASSGGATPNISHDASGVAAGTYTNATITVEADGHVTSAASGTPGGVTAVTATAPIASSGGATPNISHDASGVVAATYTNATVTVEADGHVTSAASGTAPVTSVTATAPIASSGGTTPNITHDVSGVAAGTYTNATITVEADGHVTSAASGAPGGVTAVTATAPIASSGGATPNISHDASGVTAGTYLHASFTVEADGHVTAAASGAAPVTSVTATAPIASSGGATPNISHNASGVAAATYTNATVTVEADGHVTAASSGTAPVTSVTATAPIASSGGATPNISHNASGVAAATYTYATVTVEADGHVTAASSGTPPAPVTWANDLANSTNTDQYVSAMSFSSSPAGGTIPINGTGTALQWAANNTGPETTQSAQASTSAGSGAAGVATTIAAQAGQAATGATHNGGQGGNLALSSGVGGTSGSATAGAAGSLLLQVAAQTLLTLSAHGLNAQSVTKTGNYTVDSGAVPDVFVLANPAAGFTITLPTPTAGRILFFKDISGTAETNNVTIAQHASESIEGLASSYLLQTNWQGLLFTCDGTNWFVFAF